MKNETKEKIFQDIISMVYSCFKGTKKSREDFNTWLYPYIYNLKLVDIDKTKDIREYLPKNNFGEELDDNYINNL